MTGTGRGSDEHSRAQSNPIAIVLVFGLVIASTTIIVVAGGSAISSTQNQLSAQNAETKMTQLDSQMATVALGSSSSQEVALGTSSTYKINGSAGRVIVSNSSGIEFMNATMGSVVYQGDGGQRVAYQGGGVWRSNGNEGSVMVSPPEFHYRDGTLTLPMITIRNNASFNGDAVINRGERTPRYPKGKYQNPIKDDEITVTIQSEYCQAWQQYFQQRTEGGVIPCDASDRVKVRLVQPRNLQPIKSGLRIGGTGGKLQIQSGNNGVIDSYDSSNHSAVPPSLGPPGVTQPTISGDADIVTTQDIEFNGKGQITGDLTTSGEIRSFSGSGDQVAGNLSYGEGSVTASECNKYIGEDCTKDASVEPLDPADVEISSTTTEIKNENNNSEESCFSEGDAVDFIGAGCSNVVTLEEGDYYTDNNLQVGNNQKLILDTTAGDIRIAVDDGKEVEFDKGNVTVVGDGRVNIYSTYQYQIQGATVWNRGWDATQLWMYCTADCQVDINNNAIAVGTIYAPSSSGATGAKVEIDGGNTEFYGSVVGGGQSTSQLKSNADIHYDRALASTNAFEEAPASPISYLHISENRVNITSD